MNTCSKVTAIVGATIVDGNGGVPIEGGVVLIEGKRITAVGDRSTPIPEGATRIDVAGKFVVPGLMDAYVYLIDGESPTPMILHENHFDELAIESAQVCLRNGVTTVFDAWGPRDDLIKAREAINQGRSIGARIYLCGNFVGFDGPFSDDFIPQYKVALFESFIRRTNARFEHNVGQRLIFMSPEQVRREVREYAQSGVDYISYAISDHRQGAMRYMVFSPRVQQVIVEEGHRAGLPVAGFRPATGEALYVALETGLDVIQNLNWTVGLPLSAEMVALVAQRKVSCTLETIPGEALEWYRRNSKSDYHRECIENSEINDRAYIGAGVTLLLGTAGGMYGADNSGFLSYHPPQGTSFRLGEGHFYWLLAMQEKGLKPMDALMAATRNVARAYKLDRDLGTIDRGKIADLVILDRSPLERAENYRSIHFVMKEGMVVDRDALPTQRLITAPCGAGKE